MTKITIDRSVVEQALEALGLAKLNGKSGLHPAEIEEIAGAITALRAALAEPVQEPVAWLYEAGADRTLHWYKPPLYGTPLYTAPPQRKPLPASEIVTMYDESPRGDSDMITFARAIERAHGIGEAK